MSSKRTPFGQAVVVLLTAATLLALSCCSKKSSAQTSTTDLQLDVKAPFHFVAYGDTRFHDPKDTEAANPPVRIALVQAIAGANPAFICFTGDIVYTATTPTIGKSGTARPASGATIKSPCIQRWATTIYTETRRSRWATTFNASLI